MVWQHVPFRCPSPEAQLPLEAQLPPRDSDTPREAEIKGMWQLLKCVLRDPYGEKAAWKNANDTSAPAVKKQRLIQYPPIVIIIGPTLGDKPGVGCLLVNDAFCDDITPTILNAHTIHIDGVHTPLGEAAVVRCAATTISLGGPGSAIYTSQSKLICRSV